MLITTDWKSRYFTLTTGPVDAYTGKCCGGLARPVLYDYDPAFGSAFLRTVEEEGARRRWRTAHMPVISARAEAGARARGGCGSR